MKSKPLIMSGPMVLATMAGQKTQTRRVMRPQPDGLGYNTVTKQTLPHIVINKNRAEDEPAILREFKPPYQPGDVCYLAEAYRIYTAFNGTHDVWGCYLADNKHFELHLTKSEWGRFIKRQYPKRNTNGMFMYRSLARTWLEILKVKAERIQDISEEDAGAEGFKGREYCPSPEVCVAPDECLFEATYFFMKTWDSLNAKRGYPYDSNPWVWAYEFKRCDKPRGE